MYLVQETGTVIISYYYYDLEREEDQSNVLVSQN